MWGKSAINTDDTMFEYIGNDVNKAIKNIKDVLFAYKYHMIPTISQYLVNQANRVGNMFESMDGTKVPQLHPLLKGQAYGNYQRVGLRDLWNQWIRGRTDKARLKAETYMTGWVNHLKGYIPSDPSKLSDDDKVLVEKIVKLDQAVNAVLGTWNNPF